MDRKEFLQKSFQLSIGSFFILKSGRNGNSQEAPPAYDLVAVKNGEPDAMFDKGIAELGGISKFVKKGQTVLIKPNMSWYSAPEQAGNTNPILVKRVIEHCLNAGAKKVYVLDNILNKDANKISMVEEYSKNAGAMVVIGKNSGDYQNIEISKGVKLKSAKVHNLVLETDVYINIPVLKHHSSTNMTASLKNLMGLVWDRGFYHANGLNQCIADFPLIKKPVLNIIDAYRVMRTGGPSGKGGSEVLTVKMQIISPDIVAADSAAAAQAVQLGVPGSGSFDYIDYAFKHGLGKKDLNTLRIKRIAL